jgi:hypothetical protein
MSIPLVAFFISATLVALRHYLRVRDRRHLPLVLMFALLALAHSHHEQSPWGIGYHVAAGLAGLAQLVVLSPRTAHPPAAPPAAS